MVEWAFPPLTPRERDVLDRISEGYTMQGAANVLGIKPGTIENVKTNTLRKFGHLGVSKYVHVVTLACQDGQFQKRLDIQAEEPDSPLLTVLHYCSIGYTSPEIGAAVGRSTRHIGALRADVLIGLQAHTLPHAVRIAYEHNYLPYEPPEDITTIFPELPEAEPSQAP